jgi:hypothetical protein
LAVRFASTILEQCNLCGNLLKPVYKAGFVLQDEKESQLVVWVFDEAAVGLDCVVCYIV